MDGFDFEEVEEILSGKDNTIQFMQPALDHQVLCEYTVVSSPTKLVLG